MKIIIYLKFFLIIGTLANGGEFIDYEIPKEVDKYGPIETRDQNVTYFRYFTKGSDPLDKSKLVGVEKFENNILVEKNLYLNGTLHGVQREWFENKKLRSEIPYENGTLNGRCRHWSENGKLVGSYMIKDGEGDVLIFQENGFISKSESFRRNKRIGWVVVYHQNGKIRGVNKIWEGGYIFDYSASLYNTGDIRFMVFTSPKSDKKNGFIVYFLPGGNYLESSYYLDGEGVKEKIYVEEMKENPNLPKLPNDPKECRNLLNSEIKKVLKKYSNHERVKIPLELNDEGGIVTISGNTFPLPPY
jgi:hypothetical protein